MGYRDRHNRNGTDGDWSGGSGLRGTDCTVPDRPAHLLHEEALSGPAAPWPAPAAAPLPRTLLDVGPAPKHLVPHVLRGHALEQLEDVGDRVRRPGHGKQTQVDRNARLDQDEAKGGRVLALLGAQEVRPRPHTGPLGRLRVGRVGQHAEEVGEGGRRV